MLKNLSIKVIIFGFIFTFFSSFGQSFFLGLFNESIRNELDITHGQFGSIYASATLLSSIILIWVGKKIDDFDVLKFSFFVISLLAISTFTFSKINSVAFLFFAILLMRFSGQGMMSHTASTTISRYFTNTRGKALSTGWFGLSTAEFLMPVTIIYALTIMDWRNIWIIISVAIILFGFIFTFFSSFGQSFFLGLFNSSIRDSLSITHGQFGSIYASATLLSSICLLYTSDAADES